MEQMPSCEPSSHSASQKIHRPLWNPKDHVQKSQPLAPLLS